jgi:hypothetical protein
MLAQPSDDPAAFEAMDQEIAGGKCEFNLTISNAMKRLRPISFISKRVTTQSKKALHSYMREASGTGVWAMEKIRFYLFGKEFTWICDCSGIINFFRNQQAAPDPPSPEVEVVHATVRLHHRPRTGSDDERCRHALRVQQLGQGNERHGQTRSHGSIYKGPRTRNSPRPQVDSFNDPVSTGTAVGTILKRPKSGPSWSTTERASQRYICAPKHLDHQPALQH